MEIPQTGFCIHLKRDRQEQVRGRVRTVGDYECYWNGSRLRDLSGQILEPGGPGDNTSSVGGNYDRRVEAGIYPLFIQNGTRYKTYDYSDDGSRPNPGLLLGSTEERVAILIHPGSGFLSSEGCLNPASGNRGPASAINFAGSREKVIEFIEVMKEKLGARFPASGRIPGAVIVIEGEPG